jgi:hypothetical protein
MWSNNGHAYSWIDLGFSLAVLLLLAVVGFCFSFILFRLIYVEKSPSLLRSKIFIAILSALSITIFAFFFDIPLRDQLAIYRTKIIISAFLIICLLLLFGKQKIVNIFLIVFIVLSIGKFFITHAIDAHESYIDDNYREVLFKKTPNIYLFWFESFHDFATLRNVYGVNTKTIEDFFIKNNFIVYEKTYSQGPATLISMTTTYAMRNDLRKFFKPNMDVAMFLREIIAGNRFNRVLRVFKSNGYRTVSVFRTKYYFLQKGELLDESDIDMPVYYPGNLNPLYELNNSIAKRVKKYVLPHFSGKYSGDLEERVAQVLKYSLEQGKPFFFSFKGGAGHSPSYNYTWKNRDEWVHSRRYKQLMARGIAEAFKIIDNIIAADPASVIILLGDHGALRLRGIWAEDGISDFASMENFLIANGLTVEDLASDIFGITMAVRMPEGAVDISQGHVMSPMNLFRFIFAELSEDKTLLEEMPPAESVIRFPLVIDGKVQHMR